MRWRIAIIALLVAATAYAQQPTSFDEFRIGLLSGYGQFRDGALSEYTRFLDSIWVEVPQQAPLRRSERPKPAKAPVADGGNATDHGNPPSHDNKPVVETAPEPASDPKKEPEAPQPQRPMPGKLVIDFYGMPIEIADARYDIPDGLNQSTFSKLWQALAGNREADAAMTELKRIADEMNLNGYLRTELARCYANAKFGRKTQATRTALAHYLIVGMGYDARLAVTDAGLAVLALPCDCMVYAKPYLKIDGRNYFLFPDQALGPQTRFFTCQLPADADFGRAVDMSLCNVDIPSEPERYAISDGTLSIEGEYNANLKRMLCHYPQMPIGEYARSVASQDMRESIVGQMREQLQGRDKKTAIGMLLRFVQKAFGYATDDDYHGYEKPYFFEEMPMYAKCDCEDRSVFYSYLLGKALGVESALVSYPGHVAVAVHCPEAAFSGESYVIDGKEYFVSDPTYIGAATGQCMPQYAGVAPGIEYVGMSK